MKFEWDFNKAKLNIENHGVSFDEATEAFYDTNAVYDFDSEHSDDEFRFYLIGFSSRRLLYIVYVEKIDADTIRIITAREAEAKYRNEYAQKNYEKE